MNLDGLLKRLPDDSDDDPRAVREKFAELYRRLPLAGALDLETLLRRLEGRDDDDANDDTNAVWALVVK